MIAVMLMLILIVTASSTAVLFLFFRRLNRIEEALWGSKRQEAAETASAMNDSETPASDAPETPSP